jgi:hypothetical protein
MFVDHMTGYLSPFIASYCARHNLNSKALLILDNAPSHPVNVEDHADNIIVVFLSPNTTPILQPVDWGVTDTFRAYYLQLIRYLLSDLMVQTSQPLSICERTTI